MPYPGKAEVSALRSDAILNAQMAGLHGNADAESIECQNA
jgi:hypothetical protein